MRYLVSIVLSCLALGLVTDEELTTKTVVTVDEIGAMNVSAVATVTDLATNAANTVTAQEKANAAIAVATEVTNAVSSVVSDIMDRNTVIYRYGYVSSFSALVTIDPDVDKLVITDVRTAQQGGPVTFSMNYVCTVDISSVPILVHAGADIHGGKTALGVVNSAYTSTPVYTGGAYDFLGDTYNGHYTIDVTVPETATTGKYFYYLEALFDDVSGDGATLNVPNGVTGGESTTVQFGDKTLTFYNGLLVGVN